MKIFLWSFFCATCLFAAEPTKLPKITVKAEDYSTNIVVPDQADQVSDTAGLLRFTPGVDLNSGGGISSLPSIHGMASDRVNIKIDGAQITSSCPNHMNPSLSYIDPSKVAQIETLAGITPVSAGGDSIGGSIIVSSKKLQFAQGDELHQKIHSSLFFKSNNQNRGASLTAELANKKLSILYSGFEETASDYKDGFNNKIKSTLYKQNNHMATIGRKIGDGVIALKVGRMSIPYQGFPNQYMDMTGNLATSSNLSYQGKINQVNLEANIYQQHTTHSMNALRSERTNDMPMNTSSNEYGHNIKATFDLNKGQLFKMGHDYNRYRLNDWWPAVPGVGIMSPNTFRSINNGKRDRVGFFGELESQWSPDFMTSVGVRTDIVSTDAGGVEGYNQTSNLPTDAQVFNNQSRFKRNHNYETSLLSQFNVTCMFDVEIGYARKTRAPNLYERYAWAGNTTNPLVSGTGTQMDMMMINWFGDGNGYVGNIGLKPEVANTISSSFSWHNPGKKRWEFKITPYYTSIKDYIDADLIATSGGINFLKFNNHNAQIAGTDISSFVHLPSNPDWGDFYLKFVAGYTRGRRTDGEASLYHIMPFNYKLALEHAIGKWNNSIVIQYVASKTKVNEMRLEPKTNEYGIVDIKSSYNLSTTLRLDFSVTNVLNKYYQLPLGGINMVNNLARDHIALTGMGRSYNSSINMTF